MNSCHRLPDDIGGYGKQTSWTMTGFKMTKAEDGEYVFEHPDNDVVITVHTESVGFRHMTERELGVMLAFKEGRYNLLEGECYEIPPRTEVS